MRRRVLVWSVLWSLVAAQTAAAESPFEEPGGAPAAPAGRSPFVATLTAPDSAAAGGIVPFRVAVHVPAGHYLYDERTQVDLVPGPGVELVGVDRPAAEKKMDPFLEEEVQVFKHDAEFVARVRMQQPGVVRIVFSTQGCSTKFCYFPQSDTLSATVAAGGGGAPAPVPDEPPAAVDSKPGMGAAADAVPASEAARKLHAAAQRGVVWLLLLAFGAGIATSFTPCVYPMIPITIGIIGARSSGRRSKGFTLSLLYVLGIAVTYSALGTSAALTGSLFGSVLQNKFVVLFVAAVFALMAMSLFGAFELQVPPALAGRLNSVQGSGYPGAFLLGLIAGVVASPCIGPVLVAMLAYVATSGNALLGFGLFFTFALGLGVLFIVLGTFTGMLTSLPKSGNWMLRVKLVFGIVFLGLALYYLHPHLPHGRAWLPAGAALMALGLALKAWRPVVESDPAPKRWRTALGRAALMAGLYGLLTPVLPGGHSERIANPAWIASEAQGMELARAQSKPMLVDFGAEWCVACKELEKFTFSDPRVIEQSKGFVAVRVNATKSTPEVQTLMKKYGILGLPWVAFVEPDGTIRTDLTVTGFIDAGMMLERMQRMQSGAAPAPAAAH